MNLINKNTITNKIKYVKGPVHFRQARLGQLDYILLRLVFYTTN